MIWNSYQNMKIKLLTPTAKVPTRAYNSNGYDLYADEDVFIQVGETRMISTGISIELPNLITMKQAQVFKIEDRSSLAAKGLRTGAGVVDFDYRGEIKIVMHNFSNTSAAYSGPFPDWQRKGFQIKKGDKIAQGLIYYTILPEIELVGELSETERNSSGFGSSGAV